MVGIAYKQPVDRIISDSRESGSSMLCRDRYRAMQRAHWYRPLPPLGGVNLLELLCNGSLDFSPLTVEMTQRSVKIFPRCRADTGVVLGRQSRLQHTSQKVLQAEAMVGSLGLCFFQKLIRKIERRSHIAKLD